MPNGSYLSPDQYRQLDSLLRPFDETLKSVASSIGGFLIVGYHDLPDRLIKWIGVDLIWRMIQLSPTYLDRNRQPAKSLGCRVVGLAWKDVPRDNLLETTEFHGPTNRLLWHAEVAFLSQAELDEANLLAVVRGAQMTLEQLNESDLSPAT